MQSPKLLTSGMAIDRFFNAWMRKNWWEMSFATQKSWRRHYELWQLPFACRILFGDCDVVSFELRGHSVVSPVFHEYIIGVTWRRRLRDKTPDGKRMQRHTPWEYHELRVNVICETGPLEPSIDGDWGVNPSSVFRLVNEVKGDEEGIDTTPDNSVHHNASLQEQSQA